MDTVIANLDDATVKFLLVFSISLVSGILTVVWFFITFQFKKFNQIIDTVSSAVGELKTVVAVLKKQVEGSDDNSKEQHVVIDRRLNVHSDKINEHSNRIVRIETKLGINDENG